MKKILACCLIISLLTVGFSACDNDEFDDLTNVNNTRERPSDLDSDVMIYDKDDVDSERKFDDYYPDKFDVPWAEKNKIKFSSGKIETYFTQYLTDENDDLLQDGYEIKNNIATIYTPDVKVTDSIYDGYLDYEITYKEVFPTKVDLNIDSTFYTSWYYHNIGFVDYYTGVKYPNISLSEDVDSFHVYGDVIWEGKTYSVSYYEFRSEKEIKNEYYENEDGTYTWELTTELCTTVLLTVPEGYNGMLLYVYVADDSGRNLDEVNDYKSEFNDISVFGENPDIEEEADTDNFMFLSIYDLGQKYK